MSNFRGGGRGGPGRSSARPRGLFANGTWQCDCDPRLPAIHFETKKAGPNKGRWFYTCQKKNNDAKHCKFFLWDSDAKPREEQALLSNSRTEPGRTIDTPSRPQRPVTPPRPAFIDAARSEPVRKRSRMVMEEDEDEFGLNQRDTAFDDELSRVVTAVETPRKAARTDFDTVARRKLPWDSSVKGLPTPQTDRRAPNDPFSTRFSHPGGSLFTPSKFKESEAESMQTMTPDSSPLDTPTPARFKDVGTAGSEDPLVDDVFDLFNEEQVHLNNKVATSLRGLLRKHARRAEGNTQGKEVLRLKLKAEEARNVELTHRNNTLQADLEAASAAVKHLSWEKEHSHELS